VEIPVENMGVPGATRGVYDAARGGDMRRETAPFGFAPDGRILACGDGPELFVYEGHGGPRWKVFADGILVGVAIAGDRVMTVDDEGRLTSWRELDGLRLDVVQVDAAPIGLVASPDGFVAVLCHDSVHVGPSNGAPLQPMRVPNASAVSFGPDRGSLGVGASTGRFAAIDPNSGSAWGSVDLGAAVTGVAWTPSGRWLVAAGNYVHYISGDGSTVEGQIGPVDETLGALACAPDGVVAAAVLGEHRIAIFDLHHDRVNGTADMHRPVGGLDFASGSALGVGLDDGDAGRFDLYGGVVGRTEPHPGRGRNHFNPKIAFDGPGLRGAAAFAKAGDTPIAKWVPPEPESEFSWFKTCGGCLLVTFMMVVLCGGCSGLSTLLNLQLGLF